MSTREEIETQIQQVVDGLGDAVGVVAAAIESTNQAADEEAGRGHEGVASLYLAAKEKLQESSDQITATVSTLNEALGSVSQTQGGLTSSGATSSASHGPIAPRFRPMRTDPEKRDEIRPYVGQPDAVATLWDAHGNRILGLHSADDDGPASTADWRPPWNEYPRLRRHVEAHAAARMQPDGHRELVMYINLPPCSYPDGCKFNIADLIPVGSRLWVHQVLAGGRVRVHRFDGTGKASK